MTTNAFNPRLTPTVLRDIAGKLKSGELKPVDIIGFDLGATLKKKPADDRPAFADDSAALDAHCISYCMYFLLMAANPDSPIVPSVSQDDYGWHVHLSKPVAYFDACQAWAGQIIDHEGGFGSTAEERPILESYFAETKRLWAEAYGEPHPVEAAGAALCHKICKSCHSRGEQAATCKGQGGKCWTGARAATCKGQGSKCFGRGANCRTVASGVGQVAATCFKTATTN